MRGRGSGYGTYTWRQSLYDSFSAANKVHMTMTNIWIEKHYTYLIMYGFPNASIAFFKCSAMIASCLLKRFIKFSLGFTIAFDGTKPTSRWLTIKKKKVSYKIDIVLSLFSF